MLVAKRLMIDFDLPQTSFGRRGQKVIANEYTGVSLPRHSKVQDMLTSLRHVISATSIAVLASIATSNDATTSRHDVVIYGGTSAAITAADKQPSESISAKRDRSMINIFKHRTIRI